MLEKNLVDKLSKNELFDKVNKEDIEKISPEFFIKKVRKKDDVILEQNSKADEMYLILSGSVRVTKQMPNGKEVLIANRKENEYFGELALIEDSERSANIYAKTDVELIIIKRNIFYNLMDEFPQIKNNITKGVSAKLRQSDQIFTVLLEKYRQINEQKKQLETLNKQIEDFSKELQEKNQKLFQLAITDKMTGIYNRAYVMDHFNRDFIKSKRHGSDLACIMMDIDDFKSCNDSYGHLIGDHVLKSTAELIKKNLREEDVFGRYGGEEFLIVLPNTLINDAEKIAETIRKAIEKNEFESGSITFSITMSFGITDIASEAPQSLETMLDNADKALYSAKERGKNKVVAYSEVLLEE